MDRHSPDHWFAPVLQAGLCSDPARVHGLDEGVVVAFVLVGVGLGELDEGPVEDVAGAEVGGDGDPVAGAGVGPGQRVAAQSARRRPSSGASMVSTSRGALPVPELADVEVALDAVEPWTWSQPRKMSLPPASGAGRATTRWPWLAYSLAPDELLEHRASASLACRNSGSCRRGRASARSRPGCRHCRHRPPCGPRGQLEVLEQVAAVARQRPAVAADHAAHEVVDLVALDARRTGPRSGRSAAGR